MAFPFHFLLFLTLDNLIHSVSSTYIFQCYIFCPAFLPTLTVLLSYLLTHLTGHLNLVKNCTCDFCSTSILLLFTISGNNATNLFKPEARKVFLPQPSLSPSTSNTHLVLHILISFSLLFFILSFKRLSPLYLPTLAGSILSVLVYLIFKISLLYLSISLI